MSESHTSEQVEDRPAVPYLRVGRLSHWIGAVALVAIAGLAAVIVWVELTGYSPTPMALNQAELVWCDAHRALVALGAQSLDLLPDELASESMNVVSDDTDETNEYDSTALQTVRYLREALELTPPAASGDIGISTPGGFESHSVLGVRSVGQAAGITQEWIAGLEGGWEHPHAVVTCRATHEAFR